MSYDLPQRTLSGQYADSASITQMVDSLGQQINPDPLFSTFLSFIWSLDTAQGFGLDILGRLINLPRLLNNVPVLFPSFGAPGPQYMNDDQYRRALFIKAAANIGDHSFASINSGLRVMSNGRGNAFASKLSTMVVQYNFYYAPDGYEYAIINSGNILIRPVGVGFDRLTIHPYFGFNEGQSWNTFDQAVFAAY